MDRILLKEPNKDVEDAIFRIEDRSIKMLTALLVVTGLVIYSQSNLFLTQPTLTSLITILLFFSSIFFYFLSITKTPSAFYHERSKEELLFLFQKGSLAQEEIKKIIDQDDFMRKCLIKRFDRKSIQSRIANGNFLGFIFIFMSAFFILKYYPSFFKSTSFVILYSEFAIIIPILFYFLGSWGFKEKVTLKKGNQV